MKTRQSNPFRSHTSIFAALSVTLISHFTAQAAGPYYWDNNGSSSGFGSAAGTWAAPTTGDATQGWSSDSTGVALPVSQTTATTDALNFGYTTTGLLAGTISVSGTVNAGNMTFALNSGNIVLAGGTITQAAAETITVNNTTDTISSVLAGAATSLTKAGTGTLILSGNNTYTGTTIVSGGTLSVTGSYTGPSAGSKFVANGGSLTFNMGAGTANFYADGYTNSPQIGSGSAGTVTLQSGTLNIKSISTSAAGLRLGEFASGNGSLIVNGGTLNVPGRILMAANGNASTASTLTVAGGTVNMGTVGSGSYTDPGAGLLWFGAGISTVNLNSGTLAVYSLYDPTAGSNVTVNLNGGTLKAIANNTTFTNATAGTFAVKVKSGGAVIDTSTYNITIPAALLTDTVSLGGGLTKNSAGTLTLSAANTYTGATNIIGGTLQLAKEVSLYNNVTGSWTATNLVVSSGATAAFNVGALTNEFTSADLDVLKGLGTASGGFLSGSFLGLDTTNANGGNFTYNSNIANPNTGTNVLGLTKLGNNTLTLGGANTYTGGTNVAAGALSYLNTNAKPASGTTTVAAGATLGLGVAATGSYFTSANIDSLFAGTLVNVTNSATSNVGIDTTQGNFTYATSLSGSPTRGLVKLGSNTLTLTGANTYTGATIISAGTLLAGSGTNAGNTAGPLGVGSALSLGSSTTLNLSGFNITVGSLATATGTITDTSAAGSGGILKITGLLSAGNATLITGSAGVQVCGTAGGALLTNTANTYSGGTYLGNGASAGRIQLATASQTIGTGTPGALTTGIFGTGAINLGKATTDQGQLYLNAAGITLNNAITYNSQLGTDVGGAIRSDVANAATFAGTQTAGLSAITVNTYSGGGLTISGQITGSGTFTGTTSVGTGSYGTAYAIATPAGLIVSTTNRATSTLILNNTSANNNYTGDTYINATGVLQTNAANQLPSGAGTGNVYLNGKFNMQGLSQAINGLSGSGTLDGVSGVPTLTLGGNNATGLTFSGVIKNTAGTLALTKTGSGTLALSGANTYIGATLISGGTLALSGAGAVNSTSGITVNGSAATFLQTSSAAVSPVVTLTQGTLSGSGTVNTVNVGAGTGGIVSNNNGVAGASLSIGALTFNGTATVNTFSSSTAAPIVTTSLASNGAGVVTINPAAPFWLNGSTYDLISYVGSIGGAGIGQFLLGTVGGLTPRQTATFGNSGSAITLAIAGDNPYWTGSGDGNWNLTSSGNWQLVAGPTTYLASDLVLFNDNAAGTGPVTVNIDAANVSPTATIFSNSSRNYVVSSSGGYGIATGSLTMNGTGTVTLSTNNTYTGATNLNAGTLILSGSGTLGTGSALTLSGGQLDLGTSSQTVGAVSVTAAALSGDTIRNGSLTGTSYAASNTTGTAIISANLLANGTAGFAMSGAGGTVTLAGANTYTGATNVTAGTLSLTGSLTGSIVTVSAGTLSLAGSLTGSNVSVSGSGVFSETSTGGIAGAGVTFVKSGTGTATLAGTNTYTGNTTVTGGILNITGSLTGNSTTSTLALGTTAANTVTNVSGNMTLFSVTGSVVAGSNVVYNQTAGTVNLASSSFTASNNSYTYTNLTGGTLNINGGSYLINTNSGTTQAGVVYVDGTGKLDFSGTTSNGGMWDGTGGSLTVGPGGTVIHGNNSRFYLGAFANDKATINVAGGSFDIGAKTDGFWFGNGSIAGMSCFVNIASGTFTMGTILTNQATGTSKFYANFAGGTLKASANLTHPFNVNGSISTLYGPIDNSAAIGNTSQNFTGGLTIDTNGFAMTYGNSLLGATSSGVAQSNITVTGGSGYIGAPLVQFTGGTLATNGSSASGYAVISGGAVTGIVITSPGTYTVAPTVTLTGGGGAGASVSLSGLTANAADSGLTKVGANTLTLTGANTYTGATTINAGTLQIGTGGTAGSISTTSGITNNAALIYNHSDSITVGCAISGSGTLSKQGVGILTLTNTNTYTGATTVSVGTLALVGGSQASPITVSAGASLEFSLDSPTASTSTYDLTAGTIKIVGSPTLPSYTLTTSSGIIGTPTLAAPIAGYELTVIGTTLKLALSGTPYSNWAASKGLDNSDAAHSNAKDADPDGDGHNNLYEFAFDGNPLSAVADGKIVSKIATLGADQVLTLTLPVRKGATFANDSGDQLSGLIDGIYYRIEGCSDLTSFSETISEVTGGDAITLQTGLPLLSSDWTYRTFRVSGTVSSTSKDFMRAKISETP